MPATARSVTRRNFYSSIVPPGENVVGTPDGGIVDSAAPSGNHPKEVAASLERGNCVRFLGLEPCLAQRPSSPGELLLVPARELRERDAPVGRLDEPAVTGVDRR